MVVIAQLAEHRIVVPSVVGSSPTIHPRNAKYRLVFRISRCKKNGFISSSLASQVIYGVSCFDYFGIEFAT